MYLPFCCSSITIRPANVYGFGSEQCLEIKAFLAELPTSLETLKIDLNT
jgi:hypothetical protein